MVPSVGAAANALAASLRSRPTAARWLLLCLACMPMLASVAPAQAEDQNATGLIENRVKAASLFRFLGYVEWPTISAEAAAPYRVGFIGADEIAQELSTVSAGRLVDGRSVAVRRMAAADPLVDVDAVFIGYVDVGRLGATIRRAQGLPVLVVTSADGALAQGSMINFRIAEDRVRFEVSLDAVEQAGLHISSRMLSVALQVVRTQTR